MTTLPNCNCVSCQRSAAILAEPAVMVRPGVKRALYEEGRRLYRAQYPHVTKAQMVAAEEKDF